MKDGDAGGEAADRSSRQPTRYHDDSTYASDPIPVEVAEERLRLVLP
jgi:hypothetical protein